MKKYLLIFLAINITSYAMDNDGSQNDLLKSKINFILNNSSTNTDSSTDSDTDLETNSSEEDTFGTFLSQYATPEQLSTLSGPNFPLFVQNSPPYIHSFKIETDKKTSKKDLPKEAGYQAYCATCKKSFSCLSRLSRFEKVLKSHSELCLIDFNDLLKTIQEPEIQYEFKTTCPLINEKISNGKSCTYQRTRVDIWERYQDIITLLKSHLKIQHYKNDSTNETLFPYISWKEQINTKKRKIEDIS